MEAVDLVHAVEGLQALVRPGPCESTQGLQDARAILAQLSRTGGLDAYQSEKLAAVERDLVTWFGPRSGTGAEESVAAFRHRLLADIEHLKKALARRSHVQD